MTRHIRWQILLIVLGVVLVGILLAYLAVNYTAVLRPGRGGTYVEGVVGSPVYLNPLLYGYDEYNKADRDICALLFSGLTRLNERGEVEADLAREWKTTLDGLTYTFHLRSNAYWHDGVPVTADDVIFTINLLKDPNFPGPPELGSSVWQVVEVERVNRLTVRFTLPEPFAPFLDYTTFGILPVHVLGGTNAEDLLSTDFNLSPIGSGPFKLAEIEVEDDTITALVLEHFSKYYGARPYLDRVQFRFYTSDQAVFNGYEAGEVEGIAEVATSDLSRARILPDLNLFSARIAEQGFVLLNFERSDLTFFQDPKVRQALLYALDRQRIIDQALAGQALIAHSPMIPGTWAYKEDVKRYDYDPEEAWRLLDEAGWVVPTGERVRRKDGREFAFTLSTLGEPARVGVAEMIAEQWAAIGVTTTIEVISPIEVHRALTSRDFEAILVHVALPGDPDPYPLWHEKQIEDGQNYGGFVHRRISEVTEQGRTVNGRERRRQLYEEFQTLFAQEVPALLLYVPVYTYGVDNRIHAVQIGPLMTPPDRFRTISDWWIVPHRVFVSETEAGG